MKANTNAAVLCGVTLFGTTLLNAYLKRMPLGESCLQGVSLIGSYNSYNRVYALLIFCIIQGIANNTAIICQSECVLSRFVKERYYIWYVFRKWMHSLIIVVLTVLLCNVIVYLSLGIGAGGRELCLFVLIISCSYALFTVVFLCFNRHKNGIIILINAFLVFLTIFGKHGLSYEDVIILECAVFSSIMAVVLIGYLYMKYVSNLLKHFSRRRE